MSLSTLPGELYTCILSHVPSHSIQQTILSLTRALPYAQISQQLLFQNIRIKHLEQLPQLYMRLRSSSNEEKDQVLSWIRFFSLECWNADAEVLLNVVHLLSNLESLVLWIGPLNFAPQHLEELFDITKRSKGNRCLTCIGELRELSLRFKPYVEKATYYKFLEGSYFDSTLYAISRWPKSLLPSLSIAQDPFNQERHTSVRKGNQLGFAQPIVFFQIEPALPILLRSPTIRATLTSLRFRVPSRNIARSFTQPPPPNPPSFGASKSPNDISDSEEEAERVRKRYTHEYAHFSASPYLSLLDVSTSSIPESSIPSILARFRCLQHLIMDKCSLLTGDLSVRNNGGEWAALAKSFAIAGSFKAQEREKKIAQWLEQLREYEAAQTGGSAGTAGTTVPASTGSGSRRAKKGRRGVATATISLRKEDAAPPPPLLEPDNLKNKLTLPSIGGEPESSSRPIVTSQKIRILPTIPTLKSFATNFAPPPSYPVSDNRSAREAFIKMIRAKWEEGWAEGVAQLVKKRQLMRASWRNGVVRVIRFAEMYELRNMNQEVDGDAFGDTEEGLDGLVDIQSVEEFDVDVTETNGCGKAPILCLGGSGHFTGGHSHMEGCGHERARNIWGDEWND
ncbi:serine threonine protein kinase [Moniliophthora roreri]|nr:serine threonine protein kinase [Moniliophthora roreri]